MNMPDPVYPRPRGGTGLDDNRGNYSVGLSPPTRGNRAACMSAITELGSIPAHAGEPSLSPAAVRDSGVYPRPRGGTLGFKPLSVLEAGLSPPTRGNLHRAAQAPGAGRSIPAHAGEPFRRRTAGASPTVYPRPRGGTQRPRGLHPRQHGLSPPTRGNRRRARGLSPCRRSIPAHAGEPTTGLSTP